MAYLTGVGFNNFYPGTIYGWNGVETTYTYYNAGDLIMFGSGGSDGAGGGGGFDTSPILEEVDMLEDDIDMVEEFDSCETDLEKEEDKVRELQIANCALQNENASIQNEEVQLKSQLGGTDRHVHELERQLEEAEQQIQRIQGAKVAAVPNNKETNVDTTTDDVLGTPERRDAFFVGKNSFKTKNEALQFEVLQALVDEDWTNHDDYDDNDYDNALERIRETHQIPLGTLADNIDKIAGILREYELKKDR